MFNPDTNLRMFYLPDTVSAPPQLAIQPQSKRLKPKRQPVANQMRIPPRQAYLIVAPEGLPDSLKRSAAAYGGLNPSKTQLHQGEFPITSAADKSSALKICADLQELGIQATIQYSQSKSKFTSIMLFTFSRICSSHRHFWPNRWDWCRFLRAFDWSLTDRERLPEWPCTALAKTPSTRCQHCCGRYLALSHGEPSSRVRSQLAKMDLLDSLERLNDIWQSSDAKNFNGRR